MEKMGRIADTLDYTPAHIKAVLALPSVDVAAIRAAKFRVAIDCVNSVGGIAIPALFWESMREELPIDVNEILAVELYSK